jgi:hypothetical protein
MSRAPRPRQYRAVPVVHHGNFQPQASATLRRIKGQKFGANKGRSLTADERRAVEADLRERGML